LRPKMNRFYQSIATAGIALLVGCGSISPPQQTQENIDTALRGFADDAAMLRYYLTLIENAMDGKNYAAASLLIQSGKNMIGEDRFLSRLNGLEKYASPETLNYIHETLGEPQKEE
jgi:hypothetical protein